MKPATPPSQSGANEAVVHVFYEIGTAGVAEGSFGRALADRRAAMVRVIALSTGSR